MSETYAASRIKRGRATRAEMAARQSALFDIVASAPPMTVRYQATVRGLIGKSEAGYDQVQRDLVKLRAAGELPFSWIANLTRWQRRPTTFDGPEDALRETARLYRKSLWARADPRVEIWPEKDALAGVIVDVTAESDVPLMVTRGYPSLTFLASAADQIREAGHPTFVYHLGDFDPSGQDAARVVERKLRELAPRVEIHFERLAVTSAQIREFEVPTRPTKATNSRAEKFGEISVELDALHPDFLRALVCEVIERHPPQYDLEVMKIAERSERDWLTRMASVFVAEQRP